MLFKGRDYFFQIQSLVGEEFEMSLEEYENFYMEKQRKDSLKGNIRDKVWSQRTHGKCLRNCAESNFGKNKGLVLGSSKRKSESQ